MAGFHLFYKPDGIRYETILGRYYQKRIGAYVLNGDLYLIWYKVKVTMVGMGYWNNKIIGDYQRKRTAGETEKSHNQ